MADRILTVDELIQMLKGRKYRWTQVHHTWKPNHSNFNGSNHLAIQQGMRNSHLNRGWNDIGQHVSLFPDGLFVTGRDFGKTPAGIEGYNTGAFMTEMVGDFDAGRDKFEGKQADAMFKLQNFLVRECGATIMFHREHASKSCPGTGIDKAWFVDQVMNYNGQAQPAPVVNPVKAPEAAPVRNVSPIEKYQAWLNERYGAGLTVDGKFGPATLKASIKAYQKEVGVTADGIWGPKSKAAAENIRLNARGPLVWIAQGRLTSLGYDTEGVDGIFGTNTSNAAIRFQKAKGLGQDGIIGKNSWEALLRG